MAKGLQIITTFDVKIEVDMDKMELTPDEFLKQSSDGVVLDVRTPDEYSAGHIPGAINFPLFSNEERVVVGTLYVRTGRDEAVERGLELVGPKLALFVREARRIAAGRTLYIHCWRGGMRSGSMAWLLRTAGLRVKLLKGGYKAYRQSFYELLEAHPWKMVILGGSTGCGKTRILEQLANRGEQILNLEGLAHHKGSVFGALGELPQPTTEQFINDLHTAFRTFDPARHIWCEGESESIGRVNIPRELFLKMLAAPLILVEIPTELRVRYIMEDYGHFSKEELSDAFRRIERRLGNGATNTAIQAVEAGDLTTAIAIALKYYDKAYTKSFFSKWNICCTIQSQEADPTVNANAILELIAQN